ncbi:MAG TPA: pilus assembly protein PilM [Patescibacteria group bacterium]|nr:pilus assembly protein PilM [Patescibacteria group bacterium]
MSLFGKKEERYIGVDVGAGGMKIVELLFENGHYKLMTYGSTSRNADVVATSLTENPEVAVKHLKELVKEAGVEGKDVIASLPVHSVFSSIIAIPKVKDELETRSLVRRQAEKLLPLPLAEMIIDYQLIDDKNIKDSGDKGSAAKEEKTLVAEKNEATGRADENVRVMITGAQKTMVSTYTKIFQNAGLDLMSLETEPFALIRSMIGDDKSPIMILDLGAFRTNMTIVENGIPFINRSIKVGGGSVTQAIANQMSISIEEAEQVKYDLHASGSAIPKAVVDLFQPIVHEVNYAMEVFVKSEISKNQHVEKVILTGGSALLPGLDQFLTEQLNVRTFVGDPWARVKVNPALRPVLDELGPRFAVAIGLAMHSKKKAVKEKIKK